MVAAISTRSDSVLNAGQTSTERSNGVSNMIYPVHDNHGNRIGTVMSERDASPEERWVAYTTHGDRKAFPNWEAARQWVEKTVTQPIAQNK